MLLLILMSMVLPTLVLIITLPLISYRMVVGLVLQLILTLQEIIELSLKHLNFPSDASQLGVQPK